jgi:radical SAM superfamily enzyme YgiQ (UPF0313 family)
MRVLLISANREEINMRTWPLGLAFVAAATERAGHTVELLDLMEVEDLAAAARNAIETFHPEVIGVSVRNIDDQHMADTKVFLDEMRKIVAASKDLTSAPIILGGAGYSIYPCSLLEYLGADMGLQGEGEAAFPALLKRLGNHLELTDLPGLYLPCLGLQGAREFEKDLDRLPLPDWSLLPDSLSRDEAFWVPVQTRRGCPMECSYCSTSTIEGRLLRRRSADKVALWMHEGVKRGFHQYYFVDNTFNLPASYAKRLCGEIIARAWDIAWRCILYPIRMDEELIQLMAASGCKEVSLGFESGSELILHGMNKRFMPQGVRDVSNLLARHGIKRMGFLLLGGPGETRETVLESLRFAESLNLESMKLTVGIRIYPYTRLAEIAVSEGLISSDDDLLTPRFYVAPGMKDWLLETVSKWVTGRPNWLY